MTNDLPRNGSERDPAGEAERAIDVNAGRRAFVQSLGFGAAGAAVLGVGAGLTTPTEVRAQGGPSDTAIFNFALNLEYLEAEFYLRAAFGRGLRDSDTTGNGRLGPVIGGRKVNFQDEIVRGFAEELAIDEENHVQFLRQALGNDRVARPRIDLAQSFTAAARAAGLVGPTETFDPYANDNNFLVAAFIFEDVGVTAYRGAAPLIDSKKLLGAAAGILAVEAYHAGGIRTMMAMRRLFAQANAISNLRDAADGPEKTDEILGGIQRVNIVPTNQNSIVFERTPRQVLDVVYLDRGANEGGFFPNGVNGRIDG